MSTFTHNETGVVVSVDDSKDDRFGDIWTKTAAEKPAPKSTKSTTK